MTTFDLCTKWTKSNWWTKTISIADNLKTCKISSSKATLLRELTRNQERKNKKLFSLMGRRWCKMGILQKRRRSLMTVGLARHHPKTCSTTIKVKMAWRYKREDQRDTQRRTTLNQWTSTRKTLLVTLMLLLHLTKTSSNSTETRLTQNSTIKEIESSSQPTKRKKEARTKNLNHPRASKRSAWARAPEVISTAVPAPLWGPTESNQQPETVSIPSLFYPF